MEKKQDYYRFIKLVGFAFFVPVVMAAGPILGYFAGSFLQQKFFPNIRLALICTLIGLLAGTLETLRIIKIMIKTEKEDK